jgi:hypothetical protein
MSSFQRGPINHTLNESEIIFLRIKDVALRQPYRSPAFRKFVMDRGPKMEGMEFHHVTGSVHGLKSTDLLGCAVTGNAHRAGQQHREWEISKLPEGFANLLAWAEHLEEENKILRKKHKLPEK